MGRHDCRRMPLRPRESVVPKRPGKLTEVTFQRRLCIGLHHWSIGTLYRENIPERRHVTGPLIDRRQFVLPRVCGSLIHLRLSLGLSKNGAISGSLTMASVRTIRRGRQRNPLGRRMRPTRGRKRSRKTWEYIGARILNLTSTHEYSQRRQGETCPQRRRPG